MNRSIEWVGTAIAAAAGALLAVAAVGASLVLVVPITLLVGALAALTGRRRA